MKYNVGDRVLIKSIDWYNENKDDDGIVYLSTHVFIPEMVEHCGTVVTIKDVFEDIDDNVVYYMEEIVWDWTDEMIEGLAEEEFDLIPKFGEYSDNEPLDIPTMTTDFVKEHGLPCPEGYIFKDENGNEILTSKIILEKKKKEYPKTYEECVEILGHKADITHRGYKRDVLYSLQKLLVCRDAYWQIAGEEMGLSGSWKPDFASCKSKYAITYYNNVVSRYSEVDYDSTILVFPTEEMRDAFYENFKKEIEICKEFL